LHPHQDADDASRLAAGLSTRFDCPRVPQNATPIGTQRDIISLLLQVGGFMAFRFLTHMSMVHAKRACAGWRDPQLAAQPGARYSTQTSAFTP